MDYIDVKQRNLTVRKGPNLLQHNKLKCPKSVSLTSATSSWGARGKSGFSFKRKRRKIASSCLRLHNQPAKCVARLGSPVKVEDKSKRGRNND